MRSNPVLLKNKKMDCFGSLTLTLAMTEQRAKSGTIPSAEPTASKRVNYCLCHRWLTGAASHRRPPRGSLRERRLAVRSNPFLSINNIKQQYNQINNFPSIYIRILSKASNPAEISAQKEERDTSARISLHQLLSHNIYYE